MEASTAGGSLPIMAAMCSSASERWTSGTWHSVEEPDPVPNTQRDGGPGTSTFTGTCRKCRQPVIDCSGDSQHWHWMTDFAIGEAP